MKPLFVKAFSLIQALFIIPICLCLFLHGKANAQRLHTSDLIYRGAFSFPGRRPMGLQRARPHFFPGRRPIRVE